MRSGSGLGSNEPVRRDRRAAGTICCLVRFGVLTAACDRASVREVSAESDLERDNQLRAASDEHNTIGPVISRSARGGAALVRVH